MDKKRLIKEFASPSAEWRGKPFWAWNGELEEAELRRQIGVMQEMGFGGYFLHSRSGLITEYLGEEWFSLINASIDEGDQLGMESWLYDEDRWPSGSVGGIVTEDPTLRQRSLKLTEMSPETALPEEPLLALFIADVQDINVYAYEPVASLEEAAVRIAGKTAAETVGGWKVLAFTEHVIEPSSFYNGNTYIDTMNRRATERFLQLTHEKYGVYCGEKFGHSIKGIFTDEPHRGDGMGNKTVFEDGRITCSIGWTGDLFEQFEKRHGYDCRPLLPELFYRPHGEKVVPIKHDYFETANDLFLERYMQPVNDWCEQHNLILTGHVLHEDELTSQAAVNGSLMRSYSLMGIPGVDVLGSENFNYWVAKQLSSAARQSGQPRMLSELYGATGWDFNFKGHKRIGDWQALFGINLRCPHLSWYTMEGEAKRDYPASILHQSPWYRYYDQLEAYYARFGLLLAQGRPACDLLVINPVETTWSQSYLGWADWLHCNNDDVRKWEQHYYDLFYMLCGNHLDFDYGDERQLADLAAVEADENGAYLRVGKMTYRTVLVSGLLTVRDTTLSLLKRFTEAGGKVIFAGDPPAYVAAIRSDEAAEFAKTVTHIPFDGPSLAAALKPLTPDRIDVLTADGQPATSVYAQMRCLPDGYAFALLNTLPDTPQTVTVRVLADKPLFAERWDLATGDRSSYPAITRDGAMELTVSLPAAGTDAFVLTDTAETLPVFVPQGKTAELRRFTGDWEYTLNTPNVCVLDFARWRWQGGDWQEEQEILRTDAAVRRSIGIETRSGEMLQPWFSKGFDQQVYGRLEWEFTFSVEKMPEGPLFLAGERPENLSYCVNGTLLTADGDWWVDVCFKRMPIPANTLRIGENTVTVTADFRRATNLEALYLVGDFGVRLDGHRCVLTALPETVGSGHLAEYGLPFYTDEITYRLPLSAYADVTVAEDERIWLSPVSFGGSLLKVKVGEKETYLCWDPYEADVTDAVRNGLPIEVTVVGTRRNLFGPLHLLPPVVPAHGPNEFLTVGDAWSPNYALVNAGLTGVVLKREKAK